MTSTDNDHLFYGRDEGMRENRPSNEPAPVIKPKHTIQPTAFEREDGMAMLRIANGTWIIRAPISGQVRCWNGEEWIAASHINLDYTVSGYWPFSFQFGDLHAMSLLETLEAP